MEGSPKTYVVRLGPFPCNAQSKREIARMEREIRDDLDRIVRHYYQVGPYSKVVKATIEEA